MEKIPAILEKYDGSFRVTPERPTKRNKDGKHEFRKVKAEIFHWEETDSMDIFLCPPRNPAAASTKVVKRFDWDGSISRSIYGKYRINMPSQGSDGKPLTIKQLSAYMSEAQKWILEDMKTFSPLPKPEPQKKRKKKS